MASRKSDASVIVGVLIFMAMVFFSLGVAVGWGLHDH